MTYYYLITVILMVISLGIVLFTFEVNKTNFYILMAILLMTLANGGYLWIALSNDVYEAIIANKISYLGGCFVPPISLFLVCAICNYKVSFWQRALLYAYSFIVYAMVLTTGINDFYYAEISLEKYLDVSVLGHCYGPGHDFFYVLLYGYMGIQLILLLYSLIKKRSVSQKNLYAVIGMLVVNINLFIAGQAINPAIEIMPLAYVIDSWILLYMYRRGLAYNLEDSIMASFGKKETSGYIMFDKSLNYLGCNNMASVIFPALSGCVIDKPIRGMAETEPIFAWIEDFLRNNKHMFEYESQGRHYEGHVEKLWHHRKEHGYILELRENTDRWKYMKLLLEHNSRLERFQIELEEKVHEQTEELRIQQKKIKELFVQTITALTEAVDAMDKYTSGHSRRVAEYACMIAEKMGKSTEEQEEIYRAGLLHDIGKIQIPGEILNKSSNLTAEEYDIAKIHPITGYHILKSISSDNRIAIAAKYHHERYDGKGYPEGLEGNEIPEIARILGVADAYDAMASNRIYRDTLPQEIVRSEIEKGRGNQFDPEMADIMLQIIDEDADYSLKETAFVQRRLFES